MPRYPALRRHLIHTLLFTLSALATSAMLAAIGSTADYIHLTARDEALQTPAIRIARQPTPQPGT